MNTLVLFYFLTAQCHSFEKTVEEIKHLGHQTSMQIIEDSSVKPYMDSLNDIEPKSNVHAEKLIVYHNDKAFVILPFNHVDGNLIVCENNIFTLNEKSLMKILKKTYGTKF